ncbi:MAG: hypothetical protein N3A67_05875 [Ignavibacteria bacterium]|nr:hypothetical protein [Ignavibacteria bacterium]
MRKIFLLILVFLLPQISFADFGRLAYVKTKFDSLYYGELIAVRDSLLVLATTPFADNRELSRKFDSLLILRCNQIDYVKLLEQPAKFTERIKFSAIGALLGGGLLAAQYKQNNKITTTDWLIFPLSVALGYLLGAYFDISNYKQEILIFPECSNRFYSTFSEHSRFKNSEPKSFARKLNQFIERNN